MLRQEMNDFINKLEQLEKQCQPKFETFECSESEYSDNTYLKIRSDILELYARAQKELSGKELADFKTSVTDFLCKNSGCSLDMEVLQSYTPRVLSEEDLEYIKHNSALARWL